MGACPSHSCVWRGCRARNCSCIYWLCYCRDNCFMGSNSRIRRHCCRRSQHYGLCCFEGGRIREKPALRMDSPGPHYLGSVLRRHDKGNCVFDATGTRNLCFRDWDAHPCGRFSASSACLGSKDHWLPASLFPRCRCSGYLSQGQTNSGSSQRHSGSRYNRRHRVGWSYRCSSIRSYSRPCFWALCWSRSLKHHSSEPCAQSRARPVNSNIRVYNTTGNRH